MRAVTRRIWTFTITSLPSISNFRATPQVITDSVSSVQFTAAVPLGQDWTLSIPDGQSGTITRQGTGPVVSTSVATSLLRAATPAEQTAGGYTTLATLALDGTSISADLPVQVRLDAAPTLADITNLEQVDTDAYFEAISSFDPVPEVERLSTPVITDGFFTLEGVITDADTTPNLRYAVRLRSRASDDLDGMYYATPPAGAMTKAPWDEDAPAWRPRFQQSTGTFSDTALKTDARQEDLPYVSTRRPVRGSKLMELDLSMMRNGVYDLELLVFPDDAVGNREYNEADPDPDLVVVTRKVVIDSPLKVGQFAFSQQDLIVPTNGLPLAIIRSYNSFDRDLDSPFGKGWTFSINDLDLDLGERRTPVSSLLGSWDLINGNWNSNVTGAERTVRFGIGPFDRDVTLTLPDGQRTTFAFGLEMVPPSEDMASTRSTPIYKVKYTSPPGVNATLETYNKERLKPVPGFGLQWEVRSNNGRKRGPASGGKGVPLANYDFAGWVLKTADGTQYHILREHLASNLDYQIGFNQGSLFEDVWGDPYLDKIIAPDGTEIRFARDQLFEQPGYGRMIDDDIDEDQIRAIEFRSADNALESMLHITYDQDGRIKNIYTPDALDRDAQTNQLILDGNGLPTPIASPAMTYSYSSEGALISADSLVTAGSDTEGNDGQYKTTTFFYNNTSEPTLITSIKDPRGLSPLISEYDEDGRLVATIDAYGNRIELARSLDPNENGLRSETIFDRTTNLPTTHYYDKRGNVVTTIDPERTIEREYFGSDTGARTDLLRREWIDGELQSEFEYDSRGNRTLVRVPREKVENPQAGDPEYLFDETRYSYEYHDLHSDGIDNTDTVIKRVTITSPPQGPDAQPVVTVNEFDRQQNLTSSRTALSETRNVYHESTNRLIETFSIQFDDEFDTQGTVRSLTRMDYDGGNLSKTTKILIDGEGVEEESFTQHFGYDDVGNQLYTYYEWTNPQDANDQYRVINWTTYDDSNRPVKTYEIIQTTLGAQIPQDPNGGRLLSETVYNSIGQVVATIDHGSDPDGDPLTGSLGPVTTTRHDARGNVVESATWDRLPESELGSLTAWLVAGSTGAAPTLSVSPVVSRTVYDSEARPIVVSDRTVYDTYPNAPAAPSTTLGSRTVYDALGRVSSSHRISNLKIDINLVDANDGGKDAQGDLTTVQFIATSYNDTAIQTISSTSTVYNQLGHVTESIDATGLVTAYEYWPNGSQKHTRVDDPDNGLIETYAEYFPSGQQSLARGPDGTSTTFEYDSHGRRTHTHFENTTENTTYTVQTVYNSLGQRVAEIDQLGNRVSYAYTNQGNLASVTLPQVGVLATSAGSVTTDSPLYSYNYDISGNLISITDPNGHVTSFAYDHLNRQIERTLPEVDGSSQTEYTAYDVQGRLVRHLDFLGNLTAYEYDLVDVSSGERYDVRMHYAHTTGSFNGSNFDTVSTASLTAESAYAFFFDQLGRQHRIRQYAFDPTGDILDLSATPERETYTFYDEFGRIAKVSKKEGYLSYDYDQLTGRLTEMRIATGADTGSAPDHSVPLSTIKTIEYTYDALGRLETVKVDNDLNQVYTYTYTINGSRASLTYPDGTVTTYAYDSLNRLTQVKTVDGVGAVINQFDYTVRADGRRTRVVETLGGSINDQRQIDYSYDALGRLAQELSFVTSGMGLDKSVYNYRHDYFFDAAGNRTRKDVRTWDTGTQSLEYTDKVHYSYDARDQLTDEDFHVYNDSTAVFDLSTKTEYHYDLNGFLTFKILNANQAFGNDDVTVFSANAEGRIKSATKGTLARPGGPSESSPSVQFTYDHTGAQVSRRADVALGNRQLVDNNNHTGYSQVVYRSGGLNDPDRFTIFGADALTEFVDQASDGVFETTQHLVYDGHGSTRALIDASTSTSTLAASYDYDAYGNALGFDAVSASTDLLYTGERYDQSADVSMYYLRARYYDTGIGRFNRMDPFAGDRASPLSLHKYAYGNHDPVNNIDPNGLFATGISLGGIATSLGIRSALRTFAFRMIIPAGFFLVNMTAVLSAAGPLWTQLYLLKGELESFGLGAVPVPPGVPLPATLGPTTLSGLVQYAMDMVETFTGQALRNALISLGISALLTPLPARWRIPIGVLKGGLGAGGLYANMVAYVTLTQALLAVASETVTALGFPLCVSLNIGNTLDPRELAPLFFTGLTLWKDVRVIRRIVNKLSAFNIPGAQQEFRLGQREIQQRWGNRITITTNPPPC